MNILKSLAMIVLGLILMSLTVVEAQQGDEIAYPSRSYVKKERGFDDWVVEFSIRKDAQIKLVYCTGNAKDQGLFDKSDVQFRNTDNAKLVIVTAGGLARLQTGYKGNVSSWAQTLRVRYSAPFQPRGPSRRRP